MIVQSSSALFEIPEQWEKFTEGRVSSSNAITVKQFENKKREKCSQQNSKNLISPYLTPCIFYSSAAFGGESEGVIFDILKINQILSNSWWKGLHHM